MPTFVQGDGQLQPSIQVCHCRLLCHSRKLTFAELWIPRIAEIGRVLVLNICSLYLTLG